jgi:hypothetical protein
MVIAAALCYVTMEDSPPLNRRTSSTPHRRPCIYSCLSSPLCRLSVSLICSYALVSSRPESLMPRPVRMCDVSEGAAKLWYPLATTAGREPGAETQTPPASFLPRHLGRPRKHAGLQNRQQSWLLGPLSGTPARDLLTTSTSDLRSTR